MVETMKWLLIFSGLTACAVKLVIADPDPNPNCQAEVSPPQIVVRYGDSFSVNCSSSPTLTEGMGWESSHGGIGLKVGVSFLTLRADSVTDWKISPQCFFTLNDSTQCSQILPVTVYKMPDNVSMPPPSPTGPIVEGKMYHLQCEIAKVAPARILSVHWYKGNKIYVSETFSDSSVSPVNKLSKIDLKAHRDDNGTQIFCEANLNFQPTGPNLPPMRSESYELIVMYPPTFDMPANETLDISVSSEITLMCIAKGNPLPEYSWQLPEAIQEKIDTQNQHQLILSKHLLFPGTYACTASNEMGRKTKYFTVIQTSRDRTTFAAIFGSFVSLGVLLTVAGHFFGTPEGTFSLNKGSYLRGQPTPSGLV